MKKIIFCFPLLLCLAFMGSVAVAQPQMMPEQEAVDFINGKTYLFCTQEDDCVLTADYCGSLVAVNRSLLDRYADADAVYGPMVSCPLQPSPGSLYSVAVCSAGQCVVENPKDK